MSKDIKKVEKPAEKKAGESEFYIYQLREDSQKQFGVKPEVLDGALFNYKKTKITKSEAKKLVDVFLRKEVKQ